MPDPRIEEYARLLVERCVDVQPGDQVMVRAGVPARPLVEEVVRLIARRGAYAVTRIELESADWASEAPEELLSELAPVERHVYENVDVAITIHAPENVREGMSVSPERQALLRHASAPVMQRVLASEIRWVGCQYPTPALAQEAGMTVRQFEDFLYGASLLDWEAQAAQMGRVAERFDAADEVRIVGHETDVTVSLRGRTGKVDAGDSANVPGGEVFYSPVEDSTNGVVTFSEYPSVYGGHEVSGTRLVFAGGRVVEDSADSGADFLRSVLDTDEGARVLGELGIGCNPGIQEHMRNTLFDEKIYGTVHFAVGAGFPFIGGTNVSTVHWDMVKDLRRGGEIYCDGELVQRDGEWVF